MEGAARGAVTSEEQPRPAPPGRIRYAVVALTVAGVIALGFLLHLDADAYLVMGVPIMAAFQLLVARRPLRALWVRAAPLFRLDRAGLVIAALLAVMPAVRIVRGVRAEDWSGAVYGVIAIGGAVAAAYAMRAMRGVTVRQLGLCLATAGAIGLFFDLFSALEVAGFDYRSVLAEASGVDGVEEKGFAVIPSLLLVQIGIGVPLSIWWRRSGNLVVTGTTHAFIDSVRNAIV